MVYVAVKCLAPIIQHDNSQELLTLCGDNFVKYLVTALLVRIQQLAMPLIHVVSEIDTDKETNAVKSAYNASTASANMAVNGIPFGTQVQYKFGCNLAGGSCAGRDCDDFLCCKHNTLLADFR